MIETHRQGMLEWTLLKAGNVRMNIIEYKQSKKKKASNMSELHVDEKYKMCIFWIWVHLASFPYKSDSFSVLTQR